MYKPAKHLTTAAIATLVFSLPAIAAPKYKADVPASITTPDSVQTKYVGELKFVDAFPSDETVTKVYDFIDTSRAVELYLNAVPTASMYGMLNGHVEIGFKANHTVGITETLMNARSLWLTPQTTTPYVHAEVDVKDGPVVIEIGSVVLGLLNQMWVFPVRTRVKGVNTWWWAPITRVKFQKVILYLTPALTVTGCYCVYMLKMVKQKRLLITLRTPSVFTH